MQLNFDDSKPIYKQIVEQMLKAIKSGELKAGDRLPTERELAQSLDISRGTVKKAYKELADNNIIDVIQGSGSYVHGETGVSNASERRKLASELIDSTIDKLSRWGFSEEELSALVRLSLAKRSPAAAPVRVAIIDCNPESLALFKRQLNYIPNISISAYLIDTIILEDDPGSLFAGFDLVITTVTHYEQVSRCLERCDIAPVAADVSTSRQTILNICTIPESAKACILCQSNKFSNLIYEQMELFTGKSCHLPVRFSSDVKHDLQFIRRFDITIASPDLPLFDPQVNNGAIDEYLARGGRIIVFDYSIDRGSLIHIEGLIDSILEKKLRA